VTNTSVTPGHANFGIGFSETLHRIPHPPSSTVIFGRGVEGRPCEAKKVREYMHYSDYCEFAGGGRRLNGKGKVLETRHAGNIASSAVPFMDPGDDVVAVALA
jgi:hypothetical protein